MQSLLPSIPTMATIESDSDLEKTLMLAAADADARNNADEVVPTRVSVIKSLDAVIQNEQSPPAPAPLPLTTPSTKRKLGEDDESPQPRKTQNVTNPDGGYAKVVASHYNQLEEKGLDERSRSRIFYMRNFHNWIKSMQINENLEACKEKKKQHNAPIRVMDLCCGKGGDLLKWRKGCITHLICSDIADVSLDQCKARYAEMKERRERGPGQIYSIEFIVADATRVRIREKYKDASMKLDLISCQFAFHYSFESLPQAECMIRNASECLQPGGYFFGTMPDANEIIARLHRANDLLATKDSLNSSSSSNRKVTTFGNDVYSVVYDSDLEKPPIFGAKYNFHLDGVVDCPEFLVHFATFTRLAKKYGLKLVRKEKFHDFYQRMKNEGRHLLSAMNSLEVCSATRDDRRSNDEDYRHAEEFLKAQNSDSPIGTLSKSEWEASSLYLTFTFEKVRHTWNEDGTAKYIFD